MISAFEGSSAKGMRLNVGSWVMVNDVGVDVFVELPESESDEVAVTEEKLE